MKILIDLQSCQSGSALGGIGRYSMNLVQSMLRNANHHEFHILLSGLMPERMREISEKMVDFVPSHCIHVFNVPGPVLDSSPANGFRARSAELLRENYIASLNPDFIYLSSLVEGLCDNTTTSIGRLVSGVKTAVTLYDLIPLAEKELYLTSDIASKHYHRKLDDFRNADVLFSISEYSRQEGILKLGLPANQIVNISSAADAVFKPMDIHADVSSAIKKKFGIKDKFLMYVSRFDQRKNQESLIRAFASIPFKVRQGLQLLFVGNGWDDIYTHLRSVGARVGLSAKNLIFTEIISDAELLTLYNLCHLFVFPSLREGFGLPILEAMSCGAPVICSNTTSMPEVVGSKDALFNPRDIKSIGEKMHQALTDDGFRAFLSENGLKQSRNFSWDLSGRKAVAAMEALLKQGKCDHSVKSVYLSTQKMVEAVTGLPERSLAIENDLRVIADSLSSMERIQSHVRTLAEGVASKIGFISPWNTQCGIAMYSKYLLQDHVSEVAILAPKVDPLENDASNVSRCWEYGKPDDLAELASCIDDLKINILVIQFNYGFFEFPLFFKFLQTQLDFGRVIIITIHETIDPTTIAPDKKLKDIAFALSRCNRVLVHSKYDMERLKALGLNNAMLFPHGVFDYEPLPSKKDKSANFIIASYGFFLPGKGLPQLIDAVFILLKQGLDIKLKMVNAEYPVIDSKQLIEYCKKKIQNYGIENNIEVCTDFLADNECIAACSEADLIVFPYQNSSGFSSAAVRHGLASCRPVAVTPLEVFENVSSAVFYLPDSSVEGIAQGIKKLYEDIKSNSLAVQHMREAASQWYEANRFSRVSQLFFEIINEARENVSPKPYGVLV